MGRTLETLCWYNSSSTLSRSARTSSKISFVATFLVDCNRRLRRLPSAETRGSGRLPKPEKSRVLIFPQNLGEGKRKFRSARLASIEPIRDDAVLPVPG